jgi:ribonuclease P protein component
MLPRQSRMKRPADFRRTVREGRRAGRPAVSGHLLAGVRPAEPAKVGFVVSRAVGTAVVRNRVKRRLRESMRGYLDSLPAGSFLVIRANPAAATTRQADLAADLDLVLERLLRRQVGALRQR